MLEDRPGGHLSAMAVLRAVARPLLASIFIIQGLDTMNRPERVVKAAEPVVRPIADLVPFVPDDTERAVRLNGAIQLAAGSLLAAGWLPRLSALTLAASLVPTTAAGHRFWEVADEQERAQQKINFLKNMAMFGGLLIAAVDTQGNPSLAWRGRHALKAARRDLSQAARVKGRKRGS
jgi:putative oxidoreductase